MNSKKIKFGKFEEENEAKTQNPSSQERRGNPSERRPQKPLQN